MSGGRPSPQVRGTCPYCGRRYSVKRDGRMRVHWIRGMFLPDGNRRRCGGSGQVAS